MMSPPGYDRWASLPASGHAPNADQQIIISRMLNNAERAVKKLQERWQAERDAGPAPR
ncbi:hypothetical protein OHA77_33540 [Streptosporangium sp. NBC_01639]|uniref:hypothetical protein n=1 Tax=Streptosporangium sp. NBC_01639 TaxID=2975948 RepID=UPI00386C5CEF|nr:hypothetical protein OHA77_33540 [Streptosporangium sp. NBC_01639]